MAHRLQDIIDIEQFQLLQDRLNQIYSFPSAIIDLDGNILTATAWQDVCTKFHRCHPECEKECIKSDRYILSHLHEANPAVSYECPHGLIDNATPIVIDGTHYGNFFTGQFFLKPPDLDFFRSQARKYGFDEEAYIEAVKKVPIWTKRQLDNYLFFIKGLIEVISNAGLKSLREIESKKRIQESEEHHRSILRTAMDGIWVVDSTGALREVNEAYCRMSGYTEQELLTMKIAEIDAIESDTDVIRHIARVREKGEDRFETRHRRKDGTVYDVEVSVQHRPEDGGRIVVFLRDISDRKQAARRLEHSHDLMRYIIEHNRSAVAVHDRDLRYIYVSQRYLDDYKVSERDVIGKHHYEVFPDLPQKWRDVHQRALAGEVLSAEDDPYERDDGTVEWTRWECRPWYEADGTVGGIIVYTEVVTERKLAEERLKSLTQRLQLATTSAHLGVWDWNVHDNTMVWDDRMLDLYGLTRQMLSVGFDNWTGRLHPDDRERAVAECNAALAGEKEFDTQFRIMRPDGSIVHIKGNGMVIRGADGCAERMIGVNADITDTVTAAEEKARLEDKLVQSQKMESVGRLAGGVAHDFNNMLSVILGHVELALLQTHPADTLRTHLDEIRLAAERSADLTRQLLAFARKQTISPHLLDLNEVVAEALKMIRRLIGEDIALDWHPAQGLWKVKVDPSQIDQVMTNLCVNARDAISGGGRITVESKNAEIDAAFCVDKPGVEPGHYARLTVTDNGCGMDRETLSKIFEPFFTTKGLGKGTGLGLATVYGIVRQNNGFVNVYSEPKRGTVFSVYLPRCADGAVEAPVEPKTVQTRSGGETILIVEDERAILKVTKMLLEKRGYTVLPANSPKEAIEIVGECAGKVHLLLTDVVMPEMNGRDLAKELQARFPDMKCLFMSGYTANVIAHHGVLDSGVHFIQKPLVIDELSAKIREVLEA